MNKGGHMVAGVGALGMLRCGVSQRSLKRRAYIWGGALEHEDGKCERSLHWGGPWCLMKWG
ncbi:hypothetical protein Krac_1679 [Ktedonobacter racemifer DSM 44963]|uniref:Uncharacterized protein n=1 Tax=Ktedonobacter racemifer DSM 44963 TaxID=485913 RepID=D6U2Q5_KTERA|nr:hypothetical protein Krac_1679 [Ktedonobacter racemifer DSM 44963]